MLNAPPRWSLGSASALHACVFGWVAVVVPWRSMTSFALVTSALAGAYALTAVLALARHRYLAVVWRANAALAIGYFAYLVWGMTMSAVQVRALYEGLGDGIAAALIAACLIPALFTLPLAFWGLAATGGIRRPKLLGAALLVLLAAAVISFWRNQQHTQGTALSSDREADDLLSAIERAVAIETLQGTTKPQTLRNMTPTTCDAPPHAARFTVIASYRAKLPPKRNRRGRLVIDRSEGRSICVQGDSIANIANNVAAHIRPEGLNHAIKLDVFRRGAPLGPADSPLAGLEVRPGIDGVCGDSSCLLPWQLVQHDVFNAHVLTDAVPDARIGASQTALRTLLGSDDAPLWRYETVSVLYDAAGRRPAKRSRDPIAVNASTVGHATDAAYGYVLAAQLKDGRFRYLVDPFTGRTTPPPELSIARHAGTIMALCQLGPQDAATAAAVERTVGMLATLEHALPDLPESGRRGLLRVPTARGTVDRVGATALSLAAFLRCRPRLGKRHDALIGRLARTLLGQQRSDGSFAHILDVASGAVLDERGIIYADGQIILGLLELEAVAADSEHFPDASTLSAAITRAMDWVARDYWTHFASQFFFIEENWHCIAAASALEHHRHDGYERFCLDYLAFKSRFLHLPDSDVHKDFVGGYGVGSIVPPHNTATAGFGEALAAGIAIKRKRGESVERYGAWMRLVMGYLLRNQWGDDTCWACSPRHRIVGGFSEHMASPRIRIDYVQHAWAALGHGGAAIGLGPPSES